jgi:anti-sigma factor RsiW
MTHTPPIDERQHDTVQMLLPWYSTGQLDADERETVERHLQGCARCQADLAVERRIAREPADLVPSADAGWAAMTARLNAPSLPSALPGTPQRRAPRERRRWLAGRNGAGGNRLRWIVAGQSVAIAVLATWMVGTRVLVPQPMQGDYRTLSATTEAPIGNILVMFRPTTSEGELRRLLAASGARVVNGPTSAGAYVLMVPDAADGRALVTLRSSHAVTMAEPIEGETLP